MTSEPLGARRVAWLGVLAVVGWVACSSPPASHRGDAQRLIAIAPSLVEVVYALGEGDRMVGVGLYTRWPPEAEHLPRIGGLFDPQLETIASLKPDLALLLPSERTVRAQLGSLGIEVLTLRSETLDDVETAMTTVAERLGVADKGQQVVAEWRRQLAPRATPAELSVLLVIGRERLGDLLVAGEETFLGELVGRLGATNAAHGLGVAWAQVGVDEILSRSPQMIIDLQPEEVSEETRASLIAAWSNLPQIAAVASGCVSVIDGDYTVLPGPRLPRLYEELGQALDRCLEKR